MAFYPAASAATAAAAKPYLLAPSGWDTAYRTSLAVGGSHVTPIVAFGDSVLFGGNATGGVRNSWWLRLMDSVAGTYGSAGDYSSCNLTASAPFAAANPAVDYAVAPWTYAGPSGNWSLQLGGLGGYFAQCTVTGQAATCTFSGTGADLWVWANPSGGTFTVTIDGTPYDKNGAANGAGGNPTCNVGTRVLQSIAYRGLSAGAHTLVATGTSGNLNVAGLTAYSGTGGILPMRAAFPGKAGLQAFNNLANATSSWIDPANVLLNWVTPLPKLFLWCHGINDLQTTFSVENYWLCSQRMIQAALSTGSSVLCVLTNMAGSSNWINGTSGVGLLFQEALNRLAQVYNVASFNYTGALYSKQSASWISSHATQHPDDTGHADIATALASIVG